MFKRPHHQAIVRFLSKLDPVLFSDAECFFAGGTAIVLRANEYRESVDVDFLCASGDGYRLLRERVSDVGIDGLTVEPVALLRNVRKDQYGIRTIVQDDAGGTPIKFEIVREARISLQGERIDTLPVAVLTKSDLYAEKLLANDDRHWDKAVMNRDVIDLAMMIEAWGPIPAKAMEKAQGAYGAAIVKSLFAATKTLLSRPDYLRESLIAMAMDESLAERIPGVLVRELSDLDPDAFTAFAV